MCVQEDCSPSLDGIPAVWLKEHIAAASDATASELPFLKVNSSADSIAAHEILMHAQNRMDQTLVLQLVPHPL